MDSTNRLTVQKDRVLSETRKVENKLTFQGRSKRALRFILCSLPLIILFTNCQPGGFQVSPISSTETVSTSQGGSIVQGMAPELKAFKDTFYTFAQTQGCVGCHAGTIRPFFASPDLNTAYAAAKGKQNGSANYYIVFSNPDSSYFVERAGDTHCGVSACSDPAIRPALKGILEIWAKAEVDAATKPPVASPTPTPTPSGSPNPAPTPTPTPIPDPLLPPFMTSAMKLPSAIPNLMAGGVAILRFDLSKLTPAVASLSKAILEIEIQLISANEYRFNNLKIAGNTADLTLTGFHLYIKDSATTLGPGIEDAFQGSNWIDSVVQLPITSLPNSLPTGPLNVTKLLTLANLMPVQTIGTDILTIGIESIK